MIRKYKQMEVVRTDSIKDKLQLLKSADKLKVMEDSKTTFSQIRPVMTYLSTDEALYKHAIVCNKIRSKLLELKEVNSPKSTVMKKRKSKIIKEIVKNAEA